MLRQEIFDAVARVTPCVASTVGGVWYFVSTEDRGLGRVVFGHGEYEQDIMAHAIRLAEEFTGESPLLKGRTFIDVGANIGTSTLPALLVFDAEDAVAFEPDDQNYRLLRCNLIANNVEDRVQPLNVALSAVSGLGILERSESSGDHRVRVRDGLPDGMFRESLRTTTEIRLKTFDDVVHEGLLALDRVGLVWMDTQGHEGHVLAGAETLLRSDIPVVVEYWPYGLRRADGLDLLHQLVAENYRQVIDVRASLAGHTVVAVRAADVGDLAHRFGGETYTDLLLLK